MRAHRGARKILILLLCCATSVKPQDGIESSGAGEVAGPIISGLFESFSSGGGPDATSDVDVNVGILSDTDQEFNGTYIPLVPNSGNINSMNDTAELDLSDTGAKNEETTIFSHIQETVVTTTTMRGTTLVADKTDESVTVTSTTSVETTTETTVTETQSTTTTPPATTTLPPTTLRSTKRPPPSKTVKPVLTTTSTSDYDPLPCAFNSEDLECSEELVCFGEGEVDCTEPDENEPPAKASAVLHSTGAEYEDEYEDSAMFSTEPSDLTIRLPAWKKLSGLKRHQLSTTEVNPAEENTSNDAAADTETSAASTATQTELTTDSILRTSDVTGLIASISTTGTEKSGMETTTKLHIDLPTTLGADSLYENGSLELNPPNSDKNLNEDGPKTEISSEALNSALSELTTGKNFDSLAPDNGESIEMTESKSRRRRSKRQNKLPVPDSSVLSSSEPLKLSSFSVNKDQKDRKRCRIKGNLLCTPAPTMGICKGSGRCQALVEKKEKSTGEKGVENWAIAVIAICATAAAVTISLLIYLVVTSWKKLKVQPQNGVTTLTYVNNATP